MLVNSYEVMDVRSYAKINLALDILGRDGDYHLIESVICEVPDLYDEIEILPADELSVEMPGVKQEENLAYKAAKLLGKTVKIRIKKNIPIASGLGGGSSNAAAVLKALGGNIDHAAQLGMDVPFFMIGGVCHCTHYGEIVKPIETNLKLHPKILPRKESQSTADAYTKLDLTLTGKNREKTAALIEALETNNLQGVIDNLHNDFEQLQAASCKLQANEHLTGSGPACFTIPPAHSSPC